MYLYCMNGLEYGEAIASWVACLSTILSNLVSSFSFGLQKAVM